MSSIKGAAVRRRLATLAGSSFIALGLTAGAAILAPTAAFAANECGVQSGTTPITCPPANYSGGVTYVSVGDLVLNLGPISNAGTGLGPGLKVSAGGLNDDITVNTQRIANNRHSAQIVVDLASQNGDISFDSRTSTVSNPQIAGLLNTTRYGVLATASGTGNVTLRTGSVSVSGSAAIAGIRAQSSGGDVTVENYSFRTGFNSFATAGPIAIHASAGGGDVTVSTFGSLTSSGTHSILAETSGSGAVQVHVGQYWTGTTTAISVGAGSTAAIQAIAGSGGILLDLDGRVISAQNTGPAILTSSSGLTTINIDSEFIGQNGDPDGQTVAIRSSGADVAVNLAAGAEIRGGLDFTGVTGTSTISIGGVWNATGGPTTGQSEFGAGDDELRILAGGRMITGALRDDSHALDPVTEIDFGSGSNTVVNAGELIVGVRVGSEVNEMESGTTFVGLERFENSGLIVMGTGFISGDSTDPTIDDGNIDDVLTMRGATFAGSGDGRILMNIDLNASVAQENCTDRQANGDLMAADCLDLRDGATEGRTGIVLVEKFPGDRGAYNTEGVVLVDVGGGDSAAGDFYIHPDSNNYSAQFDGSIDKGLFTYVLAYDADVQQHRVYALPGQGSTQFPLMAQMSQSLWRTGASSWFDRQAGQREALRGGADLESGVWIRAAADRENRDVLDSLTAGSQQFVYDNSYEQLNSAITVGLDWLVGSHGDTAWVAGVMAGYGKSAIEYDQSVNTVEIDAMTAGAYASLLAGDFFLDALVAGSWPTMDNDVQALQLVPAGTTLEVNGRSFGARVEAGWRWGNGPYGVEPLVNLAYVTTSLDDIIVASDDPARFGGEVSFDDSTSLRGSLGVRLSAEDVFRLAPSTRWSLTLRQTEEFDGESGVTIANLGPDATASRAFDGSFSEVSAALTLGDADQRIAGYLSIGGAFSDGYEQTSVSTGFRYQW